MGKSNNYSQQFDDDSEENDDDWEFEDDWEEDSLHARKEHQNHRGRAGKGQVRRNIEDFKERLQLKELLGDDFDDFE